MRTEPNPIPAKVHIAPSFALAFVCREQDVLIHQLNVNGELVASCSSSPEKIPILFGATEIATFRIDGKPVDSHIDWIIDDE